MKLLLLITIIVTTGLILMLYNISNYNISHTTPNIVIHSCTLTTPDNLKLSLYKYLTFNIPYNKVKIVATEKANTIKMPTGNKIKCEIDDIMPINKNDKLYRLLQFTKHHIPLFVPYSTVIDKFGFFTVALYTFNHQAVRNICLRTTKINKNVTCIFPHRYD